MDLWNLIWIFFILSSLQPVVQRQVLAMTRRRMLASISHKRDATVITLIHRQETMSFLGFPIMRHIDIDDSESVLRAIRSTRPGRTIEIILHTPGGLVLAASQIAQALADYDGRVIAVVPHYAMSGGTLIALAADEIVIDRHGALGPVDPQLGQYPAASLVEVASLPGVHKDETLILANVGRKALRQVEVVVMHMLERHLPEARARELAHLLSSGVWTHDHPLMATELEQLGLPVKFGVPGSGRARSERLRAVGSVAGVSAGAGAGPVVALVGAGVGVVAANDCPVNSSVAAKNATAAAENVALRDI